MPQIHNVAIIGAGIGSQHADGYAELADRFRVHTICDLNKERAQSIVDKHDALYKASYEEVLSNYEIDLIDICLPPNLHFEAVIAALSAGKNVICEKPLTTSIHEADKLIEFSNNCQQKVFPVFQYRYGIAIKQFLCLKENGLLGKPFVGSLETHWDRGSDYYSTAWRGTWEGEQGGAILTHAIHIHDLLSLIFGPVKSVYANTGTRVNEIEVEDCAALSILMENGALVTSSVTLGASRNTSRLRFCFEGLTAESGILPYSPADGKWKFTARAPYKQSNIDECLKTVTCMFSGYAGLFDAIADSLDGYDSNVVTLADGKKSIEFVTAIYASSRNSEPQFLPIESDQSLYYGWCK